MLSLRHFSSDKLSPDSTTNVKSFTAAFEITLNACTRIATLFQIANYACQIEKLLIQFPYHHLCVFDFNTRFIFVFDSDVFEPD
jgi:hypothetical protein